MKLWPTRFPCRLLVVGREDINYKVGKPSITRSQHESPRPATTKGLACTNLCIVKSHFLTRPYPNAIPRVDTRCVLTTPSRREPMLSPDLGVISVVAFDVHAMVLIVHEGTRALRANHRWSGRGATTVILEIHSVVPSAPVRVACSWERYICVYIYVICRTSVLRLRDGT